MTTDLISSMYRNMTVYVYKHDRGGIISHGTRVTHVLFSLDNTEKLQAIQVTIPNL